MKRSILFMCLIILAANAYAATLITDKQTEVVSWMPGIHCTERTINAAGLYVLPQWDGPIQFFSMSYKNVTTYIVDVPDYDCSMCSELEKCDCKLLGTHKESRTDVSYIPILQGTKTPALDTALTTYSSSLKGIVSSVSSVKIPYIGTIRMCWKVSPKDAGKGGHIVYVASDGALTMDACQSTLYNITAGSISFQSPTEANGTVLNRNYTAVNVSIVTDNLDTFKFNWNGTNVSIYDRSLLLALNFNNNSVLGDSIILAKDSSIYGLDVTLNGTTYLSSCVFGSCIRFDDTNNINRPHANFTNLGIGVLVPFTVMGWFNTEDGGRSNSQHIFEHTVTSSNRVAISISTGTLRAGVYNGTAWAHRLESTTLSNNMWYFFAYSYSGYGGILYLNSVNQTSTTNTPSSETATGYWIGSRISTNYSFDGWIDELRVYNISLSALEILTMYQSEFQKYNASEYRFYANMTSLTQGTYSYSGWANDSGGNTGYTDNGTLRYYTYATTTTTTTTTTTSSSTSTTTPATLPANSILWIFTILTPILATVFTLCTLCCIGKGILPSIFASTLWYASSMWTTRIRFVDNFTVSMSTYYVDVGNWEVGNLYLVFAAIMSLYTVILVLDFIYSTRKEQNG